MTELNKRIITSFFLLSVVFIAFFNIYLLCFLIIFINYLSLDEFNNIYKEIYMEKKKIRFVYFCITTIYMIYFSLVIILFLIQSFEINKLQIMFILLICISSDIGGFVFGKIIGGKKLTSISPKKTYSGLLGSFITSYLIGLIIYNLLEVKILISLNIFIFIFLISLISQSGDLFISIFKRKAKIKDTGSILPGHGGILDRIDGILFALPVGIIIINIFS
tara:strand:+ start:2085 stop:2744 length:660 start_codon:yes stop_codon:yes gene_type:complete